MTSASINGESVASRLTQFALVATCALILAAPSGAITGGAYDGDAHPYVGIFSDGNGVCSGTLLSPTVMLTVAHCVGDKPSVYGINTSTGAPIVQVSFDPNVRNTPPAERVFSYGTFYADAYNPSLPSNTPDPDSHDLAIIVFDRAGCALCSPVPVGTTMGRYGSLPGRNVVDTLAMNTQIDIVGFGVQDLARGGGKPLPDSTTSRVRMAAVSTLITANDKTSTRFIKLHENKGGVCFGDSGGPDLLGGTNVVLAVNSFGSGQCTSNSYSYRVDTAEALSWITSTVAAHGGSL
jgi:Trypsin